MRYQTKGILPCNRWRTDILTCIEVLCMYCLKKKYINCFLSRSVLWMLQLPRLRFSHFYITLDAFSCRRVRGKLLLALVSFAIILFGVAALTSTLCLLLKICLCVWDWFSLHFSCSGAHYSAGMWCPVQTPLQTVI